MVINDEVIVSTLINGLFNVSYLTSVLDPSGDWIISALIVDDYNNTGSAEIVIPGHGIHGGSELLDYTINLYKPNKWKEVLQNHSIKRLPVFNDFGDIFEIAEQDSINGNSRFLKEAIVFVDNDNRYIKVESPLIEHNVEGKSIKSEFGRLQIFEKLTGMNNPTTDVYYKRLIINLRDDEVGIVIIMKEIL